jgi:hypothetical protein
MHVECVCKDVACYAPRRSVVDDVQHSFYIYVYQHGRYAAYVIIPGLQSKTRLMKIGEPYLGIGPGCAPCPWTLGRTSGRRSRRVTSRRTSGQSPVIMVYFQFAYLSINHRAQKDRGCPLCRWFTPLSIHLCPSSRPLRASGGNSKEHHSCRFGTSRSDRCRSHYGKLIAEAKLVTFNARWFLNQSKILRDLQHYRSWRWQYPARDSCANKPPALMHLFTTYDTHLSTNRHLQRSGEKRCLGICFMVMVSCYVEEESLHMNAHASFTVRFLQIHR